MAWLSTIWRRVQRGAATAFIEDGWFRYALILGICALLVVTFTGPEVEVEWPTVGLIGLILLIFYFPSISHIVLPGNIELRRKIDSTQRIVEAAAETERLAAQPADADGAQDQPDARPPLPASELDDQERRLIQTLQASPNAAVMEIGRLIENAVEELVRTSIPDEARHPRTVPLMLERLRERGVLREGIVEATHDLWVLRSLAVHGKELRQEDATRFLDLGLKVLSALRVGALTNWQVSAPRSPIARGEAVELGLRKKFGVQSDEFLFTCDVTDPRGGAASASSPIVADNWSFVMYPDAFTQGATDASGEYSVRYFSSDVLVATDKFLVRTDTEDLAEQVEA